MRKIEKPTIKHKSLDTPEKHATIATKQEHKDSPYGNLLEVFPDVGDKLLYAWEHEILDEDNFRDLTTYYVCDAMGGRLYFKTNSRAKAQDLCNATLSSKYTVRVALKAQIR